MNAVAIVTGASSGIGRETALLLVHEGIDVVLTARREPQLREVASLAEGPGDTRVIPGDVTDPSTLNEVLGEARSWRPLARPVLVNVAGMAEFGDFGKAPWESVELQLQLNFVTPLRWMHAILPWMQEHGSGRIVNVLSVVAREAFKGTVAYASAKAGLLHASRILNLETRRQGILISSVLPGATDTPIWEGKSFVPNRADMLPAEAVASVIRDLLIAPDDRAIDEVLIMPPKGFL